MAKRQLHKLLAREAETIVEPGRHSDGGGLYLAIEAGTHARHVDGTLLHTRGALDGTFGESAGLCPLNDPEGVAFEYDVIGPPA